jgi:erythrocyte band 7 integral membrane protein
MERHEDDNSDISPDGSRRNEVFEVILIGFCWMFVIVTFPLSLFLCIDVVGEYQRAVIFRLGRLMSGPSGKGPGLYFTLPCIESLIAVDLRTTVFDIPPQEILTKDSVSVTVDAVLFFRVIDATVSITKVENVNSATKLLAQTTLRNILGTKTMQEILTERENIATSMQTILDDGTDCWGIKVERVEIKDVRLTQELQRSMAAEAEASREARAKVIAAEGELKASTALMEASIIMAQSPAALQLRYLQTLSDIASEKNSTIIFPLPIDLITHFMKPQNQH